jgi:RNA polymerase sigma factor (sigma-70 family)
MSAETAPALLEAAPAAPALAPAEHPGDRSPSATAASLYERYYDRVYGYCLHKLGKREEAEDATQTTFLLVLRALERGVVPRLEANWLFTIAQNACRCRARARGRGREREVLSDPHVLQEVAPGHGGARDELVGLEEALDDMPDLQRRAIILREWRGCSYREISEQLGVTGSAVETLIFRARHSLAQRLEHQTIPSKRRAGILALDFTSIASALKSILGLGTGAKAVGVAASTVTALAIGLGVSGDTAPPASGIVAQPAPIAPVAPVAPVASFAPPAPDRPVATTAEVEPAATKPPRAKTRAPKAAGGQAAQASAGQPADVQTTLTGLTSSLPTSGLVEEVERQANDLVGQVTAPVTETLKPVADVKVPKIDLP